MMLFTKRISMANITAGITAVMGMEVMDTPIQGIITSSNSVNYLF